MRTPISALPVVLVLLLGLVACSGPQDFIVYGSDATGEQAGVSISDRVSTGFFALSAGYEPGQQPEDLNWEVQVAVELRNGAYLALATFEPREGRPLVTAGVVRAKSKGGVGIGRITTGARDEYGEPVYAICVNDEQSRYLAGWVVDPAVDTFTLEFTNGITKTLDVATHRYFVAIVDPFVRAGDELVSLKRIIARDVDGNIIE